MSVLPREAQDYELRLIHGVALLKQKKKICVMGLGYTGLPTAAMFATHGYEIIGVDVNAEVITAINQGRTIIEEPYLDIMVRDAVTSGNLVARTKPDRADVFIIAVPTPIKPDKKADLEHVITATKSILPFLQKGNIVILESTSPTGTVENIVLPILARSGLSVGEDLYVAYCPERVLPGCIINEIVENNRIIGGINQKSAEMVRDLYKTFVKGELILTDATTAEMCKLMENTYRDVNIALANELATICEKMGINVWEVISLCNKHPRVNIHRPGPGVGGHCLAVDPYFIIEQVPEKAKIISLSRNVNDTMPEYVVNWIMEKLKLFDPPCKVTVLGATYKANIDDLRGSPIIKIMDLLEKNDINVALFDPHIQKYRNLQENIYEAVRDSNAVVLGVDHKEFKNIEFSKLLPLMKNPLIFDTRNYLDGNSLRNIGFTYFLLGNGQNESIDKTKKEVAIAEEYS